MRVENPRTHTGAYDSRVLCVDCPWADEEGWAWRKGGCRFTDCPTLETYADTCLMAEAAKGGKGEH